MDEGSIGQELGQWMTLCQLLGAGPQLWTVLVARLPFQNCVFACSEVVFSVARDLRAASHAGVSALFSLLHDM